MSRSWYDKEPGPAAGREFLSEIAIQSTSEGIVVADERGRFVIWNRAATELVGIGAADIDREQWAEYYHLYEPESGELLPSDEVPLIRALNGEVVDEYDLVVHDDRSGVRRWLSCNARPMRDDDGRIRGGVVVFRDVTERRRVERELASYAHTVSHDLKAPLMGIAGFAQVLEQHLGDELDAEASECLDHIKAAAGRMRELIDDLLRHATIDHDWQDRAPVDLNEVVRRAIENLDSDIRNSEAEIDVQTELPVVSGFAAGLQQAFQNLIGNAIKFAVPGTRPRIEVGSVDEPLSCRLYVRDHGVGIDAKYHRRIFDVFRRLHPRGEFGGTGIGLAIVQKVADLHQGDVWVESDRDSGTTFWLRLPKRPAE